MTPWEKFAYHWQKKRVLVMGLGLQGGGVAVAKCFAQINCQVTVTDLKTKTQLKLSLNQLKGLKINFVLGHHQTADFQTHDLIIRNPSVPLKSPYLDIARHHHIPIKMETALFARYAPATLIGVTGSRGKSTTAHLIYLILKHSGQQAILGGNMPGGSTLPLLKTIKPDSLVVLELSSWQLQGFDTEKISPHIAVITSIYPDHLNRYQAMAQYIQDKKIILKYQTSADYAVLNQQNLLVKKFASAVRAKVVWFNRRDIKTDFNLKIPGDHNRENAAAALKVASILDISQKQALKAIASFTGIPYRLETVADFKGIKIVNDSTSTTPIATIKALETIPSPVILLLGGESKKLPLEGLAKKINHLRPQIILLAGSGTQEIRHLLDQRLILNEFTNQDKAVHFAFKQVQTPATILFSPGFTSFGMFNNEFERGQAFNTVVKQLIR